MQKFKVIDQPVPKIDWKQTDWRTEAIALPAALMRSVSNYTDKVNKVNVVTTRVTNDSEFSFVSTLRKIKR